MRAEDRRLSRMERVLHLRMLPMFGNLSPGEVSPGDLGLVAEQVRTRVFAPGARLLRGGEPIAAVHIVQGHCEQAHFPATVHEREPFT